MKSYQADVVIIGSGLAALMAARQLSVEKHVIIITKSDWHESNSYLAQGGIAATYAPSDSISLHLEDALTAGRFHNHRQRTEELVSESKLIIQDLINEGMPFDNGTDGMPDLAREGGHRQHRILHAGGDATGRVLTDHLKALLDDRVEIHEHTMAMDLVVTEQGCQGLWALNAKNSPVLYETTHVIIAAGGAGHVYAPSSNAPTVTGDGIAMAYRAGAKLADMEFIQFHPTLLTHNSIAFGLVSEAVRGEGAILVNEKGERLMEGVHPQADLAPRDIVSRTLYQALMTGRAKNVYLDISTIRDFYTRFPTIAGLCEQAEVDLSSFMIPVSPGAHFTMGGILTDHAGRTSIPNLFACGESACTGVHGANRIASHSLLEALLFGRRCAETILLDEKPAKEPFSIDMRQLTAFFPKKEEIQNIMFHLVGIVRHEDSLRQALDWFDTYDWPLISGRYYQLEKENMERLNMLTVGRMITASALMRTESRGGHFRTDYPAIKKKWLQKQIVWKGAQIEYSKVEKEFTRLF